MNEQIFSLNPSEFPNLDSMGVDLSLHNGSRFVLEGTTFFVFGRKQGGIGVERLYEGIKLAWPKWIAYFPFKVPPITIVETDWGLGGGSLGPFILAVHLRGSYDEVSSKYLHSVLGWSTQPTGSAYIEKQFEKFDDPMQAYVTDQIAHELGHIFFLHGITKFKNDSHVWFGLGLGLVYDRLVWGNISKVPSPVFEAFDRVWKEKFVSNAEIDQRLINPNTKNDKKFGLIRLQTYGHAKAYAYLSEVRTRIGSDPFDAYVRSYLSRPIGSPIEYDDFLLLFSKEDLVIVHQLESEFIIR